MSPIDDKAKTNAELIHEIERLEATVQERTAELTKTNEILLHEIGRRTRAEDELTHSRQRYQLATAAAKVGVWDWNIETGQFYLDPSVKGLLGYSDDEIPNDLEAWSEYVYPEDRQPVMQAATDHLEGRTPNYTFEHRMLHRDGSVRWTLVRGTAIRDARRKAVRMVGTDMDITDRKNVEIALSRNERLLRNVLDSIQDGITVVGPEFQIIRTNRAAKNLFEHADFPKGSKCFEVYWGRTEPCDSCPGARALATGTPQQEVFAFDRPDGISGWMELCAFPIVNGAGKPEGVVECVRDITERMRAEEEQVMLQSQIQQTQKLESLGVMAGGIAHDFNNLLTGILGNANLALDKLPPGSPERAHIRKVEEIADHAAELTKQMLAYSGRRQFVEESIDLNQLVEEMVSLLSVSISKKALVKYNLAKNLPVIKADPTQVRQVIMNLVTNASEAVGEKSGEIKLSSGTMEIDRQYPSESFVDEHGAQDPFVFFEISDTGVGMDPTTQKKVFEPFFTTKFAGRGLGLSAVLGIVRGHKGAIKISSRSGEGTTVQVFFPPSKESPVSREEKPRAMESWRGVGHVLLVDDEDSVRDVAKQMLEQFGFTVLIAKDGQEGVHLFRENMEEILVVLLDMTMPKMDGIEAFEEIQRLDSSARVVLMSGYNEEFAANRFAGKGLAGFIQKPFRTADLIGNLQGLLSRRPD